MSNKKLSAQTSKSSPGAYAQDITGTDLPNDKRGLDVAVYESFDSISDKPSGYQADLSVAASSSANHTLTASGQTRVYGLSLYSTAYADYQIQIDTGSGFTTQWFTGTKPWERDEFRFGKYVDLSSGHRLRVIKTNKETLNANDLHSTFLYTEL